VCGRRRRGIFIFNDNYVMEKMGMYVIGGSFLTGFLPII
jgi:hypothetical protein